jgi:hypothetical protein
MKILSRSIWISQVIAGLSLVSGYGALEAWFALPVILIWMCMFIIGWKLNLNWVPGFLLLSGCIMVGYVCFAGASILWMMIALSALLVAWDLQCLKLKFDQFLRIENGQLITIVHLRRLGYIIVTSYLLTILSQLIDLKITFGMTLLLGINAFAGLSLVFGKLRTAAR